MGFSFFPIHLSSGEPSVSMGNPAVVLSLPKDKVSDKLSSAHHSQMQF